MSKAGKFSFYHEVNALFNGKDVCVIYHHLNRNSPHDEQIKERSQALRDKISPSGKIFAARFIPYSPRAYFIITSQTQENSIRTRLKKFLKSPCGQHWDTYWEA